MSREVPPFNNHGIHEPLTVSRGSVRDAARPLKCQGIFSSVKCWTMCLQRETDNGFPEACGVVTVMISSFLLNVIPYQRHDNGHSQKLQYGEDGDASSAVLLSSICSWGLTAGGFFFFAVTWIDFRFLTVLANFPLWQKDQSEYFSVFGFCATFRLWNSLKAGFIIFLSKTLTTSLDRELRLIWYAE